MKGTTGLQTTKPIYENGDFITKIADTKEEIEQVYRLRFEVFNLELGEGLDSSYSSGVDKDELDEQFVHLVVIDKNINKVVASYRIQDYKMAQQGQGFYSAQRFDFSNFPIEIQQQSIEVSRACISRNCRSSRVFFLLWQGLAIVLANSKMRYFFGCSSVSSTNPQDANGLVKLFDTMAVNHADIHLKTRSEFYCKYEKQKIDISQVTLPQIFNIYLRFQCLVCSDPCFDEPFKTITFLILHDTHKLPTRTVDLFLRNRNK